MIASGKLVTLKRNPQYLTPEQMESLKRSMKRDGFVAPILVRPISGGKFEVISGNHRFMASQELGLKDVPCVVSAMDERAAKRLAVNLNMIHGDPNPELLAPFLAEMDDLTLGEIHLEGDLRDELLAFDDELKQRLDSLEPPEKMDRGSPRHAMKTCKCAKCGKVHIEPND